MRTQESLSRIEMHSYYRMPGSWTFRTGFRYSTLLIIHHDHGEEVGKDNEHHEDDSQPDSAVIGGVVTAAVFSTLCVLAVMTRFLYQHRQAQRTARLQEKEHQRSLEAAYRAEFHLHNSMRDSMQEYYI